MAFQLCKEAKVTFLTMVDNSSGQMVVTAVQKKGHDKFAERFCCVLKRPVFIAAIELIVPYFLRNITVDQYFQSPLLLSSLYLADTKPMKSFGSLEKWSCLLYTFSNIYSSSHLFFQ